MVAQATACDGGVYGAAILARRSSPGVSFYRREPRRCRCGFRSGARRRRHDSRHREGSDRRRDAGRRGADQQHGERVHATTTTDAAGSTSSAICRRIPITSPSTAQGFQPLERDVDVGARVPITIDLTLALGGRDEQCRGGRPRRGSARARSDGAHRHRSEPDREAAARVIAAA